MFIKSILLTFICLQCFMFQMKTFLDPTFKNSKIKNLQSVEALFNKIEDKIIPMTEAIQEICLNGLEEIYAIDRKNRNYDNTVLRADRLMAQLSIVHEVLVITAFTHADQKVRELANQQIEILSNFNIDTFDMNKKLYNAFKEYADVNAKSENTLTENIYFMNKCLDIFKRNGLHLQGSDFENLQMLKKEISKLENSFEINIREDDSGIWIDKLALEGLDKSIIDRLKVKGQKLFLGVDYPTYTAVMQNCKNRETRKALYKAFMNRAFPKNNKILDELRKKRHALATTLGFESFTDLDLSDQMIQNGQKAYDMIHNMSKKLQNKLEEEKAFLKEEFSRIIHESDCDNFEPYDMTYLLYQYKKNKLSVDEEKISEYFPINKVLSALFDIYSRFFDLEFSKESITQFDQKIPFICVKQKGQLIGYIGLDLFPRPGKYSHACCCMVIPAYNRDPYADPALAYIISNFTPPSSSKPALLKHNEVKTLYHEFGHALHALLGKANNLSLAGYNTKIDFVELPSQILEEWIYDPEILTMISSHYESNKPLDKEILDKKIAAKTFDSAHFLLRQIALTKICLEYFSKNTLIDTDLEHRKIMQQYLPHINMLSDNNFVSSFGHLSGYGAKYYSYLYSKILALDLFSFIKENGGLLNPSIGRSYLEKILEKGGRQDPHELIHDFLHRPPSDENFLKSMGVHN